MPRYEVQLDLTAAVWVEVEADSEDEAIADAKASYHVGDAQWFEVMDATVTELAEGAA